MNHIIRNCLLLAAIIASVVGVVPPAPQPSQAQTGTWYVSPTGNDTNDCLAPGTPCRTFGRVIFNAASGGTILASVGTYTDVGEEVVQISKNVTLVGGWDSTFTSQIGRSVVDGENARHGVVLLEGTTASMDRFTIQNGRVPRYYFNYLGGGINNNGGNLTLTNSEVISNTASSGSYGLGGGIHNRLGMMTIISSTIAGNRSELYGAGMYISSGSVILRDSSIVGNGVTGCCGGGIYNAGALMIERSVVDSNRSSFPGDAIYSAGSLTITNVTVSRNSGSGVAIDNSGGTVNLSNVTITQNEGIGIRNSGVANVRNSIISNNRASDCLNAAGVNFNSFGFNLIRAPGDCNLSPTDATGVDPKLADPQGNPLHVSLLLGSPAINGGNPSGCVDSDGVVVTVDQRNIPRTGRCDIGAIEPGLVFDKWVTGPYYPGGPVTYTIALSNTTVSQVFAGVSITDTLPGNLTYIPGSLSATIGTASMTGNSMSWAGSVGVAEQATVTLSAEIPPNPNLFGQTITNTAFIRWPGQAYTDTASFLTVSRLYTFTKQVQGDFRPGGLITYTLALDNVGQGFSLSGVALSDTLLSAITYASGSLSSSNGSAAISSGNVISWTGSVLNSSVSTITYAAHISSANGQPIINTAESQWKGLSQTASTQVIPISRVYLPAITRNYCANFFDDFSNPTSGWPIGESDFVLAQYLNGEYRVQSKQPYLFLFRSPACERDSYIVEADMRWEGTASSDLGLLFGLMPNFSQYYFATIDTNYQVYAIFRRNSNGTFSFVAPWAQTGSIRPGTQVNHLKVTRNGGQITLEINGSVIGSWFDGTITGPTRTGLAMAPYEDAPVADARFDNFRVTTIGSGALGLPSLAPAQVADPGQPLPADLQWRLPERELTFPQP